MAATITPTNQPPTTTATFDPPANEDGLYPDPVTVTLSTTTTDGFTVDATYYKIDGGPTQPYTGPFTVSGDGTHTIEYWSVDNIGVFEFHKTLTFEIASLRIVTESPLPSGTVGESYAMTLVAEGGTPPYTWSIAAGALPPGLTLDANTGEISGTPTAAGTYGFTVQVTDSSSNTSSKPFAVAPPPPSGSAGSDYTVPINIDPSPDDGGSDGETCTNYAVVSGELPAGLTLDPATGEVSGTPINGGTYDFTIGCDVTSSDGQPTGQTATKDFSITIYNLAPTIDSLDPSWATTGGPDFTLTVKGTNYVLDSVVHWNGTSRPTTYVSGMELEAQISAADIATAGTASVTVVNPEPGGGTSNAVTFVINAPPTADVGGPYSVAEAASVPLSGSGSDADGDPLTYAWDLDNDGTFETSGQTPTFSAAERDGPDSQIVVLQVCDDKDACDSDSGTMDITNAPPVIASVDNDGPVDEGSDVTITVAASDPAGAADPLSYAFDCGNDGSYEVGPQSSNTVPCSFDDNGSFQVSVRVTDDDGGEATGPMTVAVNNVAPTVGEITALVDPVPVNAEISTSANFTDPGVLDTHTAGWDWGDGTTSAGTVTETDGSGTATGTHTYTTPGVYTIKLTVTDKDGDSDESIFQYVVVYDPNGGFVTGGGWIDSPAGAYTADPSLTGKANFGFVSKYKPGANTPTGHTEFQFKAGDLNFHSSSYEWLVVAGAKAQFKGDGTINGVGNYGFILTAVDAAVAKNTDTDLFRIKIWNKDNGDQVVYDNQIQCSDDSLAADPCTAIRGGNIVVHKEK